jgi:hypothetical protein
VVRVISMRFAVHTVVSGGESIQKNGPIQMGVDRKCPEVRIDPEGVRIDPTWRGVGLTGPNMWATPLWIDP